MRRMYELLKIISSKTRKTVLKNEATVQSKYGQGFNICSVELESNTKYLLLGIVEQAGANASSSMMARVQLNGTYTDEIGGNGKGLAQSGGGTTVWHYAETDSTEEHTATLRGYGYYNGTYTQTGKMVAIPIETAISGGGYYLKEFLRKYIMPKRGVMYE